LCRPDFQIAILERNRSADGAARINRRPCRKKNQMVRQMSEDHDKNVCEAKYEQPPTRWNNSWPHILLAHETHEVHERKSIKKVMKRDHVDLRFENLSRVSWAKDNGYEK
jgi:hypothetical protein